MFTAKSKLVDRELRNTLSAISLLGELCVLYDKGLFESARFMSNLVFQLAIHRGKNKSLLNQIGYADSIRIIAQQFPESGEYNFRLVNFFFGTGQDRFGRWQPVASLTPTFQTKQAVSLTRLTLKGWLKQPIAKTASRVFTREDIVVAVRNQDGGAHSDVTESLENTYGELFDSFPMHQRSVVNIDIANDQHEFRPWENTPSIIMPCLRQIAFELYSSLIVCDFAIPHLSPTTVIIMSEGEKYIAACPRTYKDRGHVFGIVPTWLTTLLPGGWGCNLHSRGADPIGHER